jgi:hypothetical protein
MSCVIIIRITEFFTSEMLVSSCPETEYRLDVCRVTNDAYTQIYWQNKFCEVYVWKMYQFLQYDLWLMKYIMFYSFVV